MEMGVTVHVPRRRPRPVELVVRWHGARTAHDLRAALAEHLSMPVACLVVAGARVPEDAPVGMPPLVDGASLVVASAPAPPAGPAAAALELAVVGGPDAGRSWPLAPPGLVVGRGPDSGVRLDDTALSRRHARLDVGPGGVRVTDLGSTNGVLVDGAGVVSPTDVDTGSEIVVGRSSLRLRRGAGAGLPVHHPGDGTVRVTTTAAESGEPDVVTVDAPARPPEPTRPRIPWVTALVPLPVAAVLALVLGPQLVAFALLGPVMVLGTSLGDRWSGRRRGRRDAAQYEQALAGARERFRAAVADERGRRLRTHADPHLVLRTAERRMPGLWGGTRPVVRLGLGDVEADTSWREGDHTERARLRAAPVVLDLADVRCLGIVGAEADGRRILDWLLGQLAVSLPPDRLRIGPAGPGEWWRLPHARGPSPPGALEVRVLGAGADDRTDGDLVVEVLLATSTEALPDRCRTRVVPGPDGRKVLVRADGRRLPFVADGVGPWWSERLARALAPVRPRDAAGLGDDHPLTLGRLVGAERLSPEAIRERWRASADGPRALVGVAETGPYVLDLRRDGPHLLVGGTTGSGKSEFLRTLVTGLALSSPPERLCLLLVDFKGGAAFGPCAHLPHVVGVVTDLDEHLAERVLTSLRAELRRRERVLSGAAVSDLDDLTGPAAVPRLVVVVDELRALVEELPELVSGLVRLAAQGRSLGIHLVLATQRPSGTVTPEIQANVDLRVAFRLRDRSDSVDVLDGPEASLLDPGQPGRGFARGGDGGLTGFRTALVAPPPSDAAHLAVLDHREALRDTTARRDRAAETAAVVDLVAAAADGRDAPPPTPPWLPALPSRIARGDPLAGPGVVAVVDEPDLQRRRPLDWDPAVPLWRVVGRPLTGRTSAARAVVLGAVDQHPPERLHVHVIDSADGLSDLSALPHVGTWCRAREADASSELLTHLADDVTARRSAPPGSGPPSLVLLVVDGWDQLLDADDPRSPDPVSDRLLRVLRDGPGVGVRAVVTGGRSLLQPRWSGLGGVMLLLGRTDPLDAVAAGLRERDLPRDPPPGRGVLAGDAREVQVVHTTTADLQQAGARWPAPPAARRPWRLRPLPRTVTRRDVEAPPPGDGLLVGVAGPLALPLVWDPGSTGGRLLVTGPPRSGRTTTLLALAESARVARRAVVLVGRSRTASDPVAGLTTLGPDDVEALVERRRSDPRLVVLVDDADHLDDAPVHAVLGEVADLAERDGGAVVVATTTSTLATRYRGLDVDAVRQGCGLVLAPRPGDAEVLGIRPRTFPGGPPGRGWWVVPGRSVAAQVLLPDLAPPQSPRSRAPRSSG